MRKQVITPDAPPDSDARENWLDVNARAQVELTSEGTAYPIEAALAPSGSAWQATGTGEQSIHLLFDAPLSLRHICLVFDEAENARTQEFVRRVSPDRRRF